MVGIISFIILLIDVVKCVQMVRWVCFDVYLCLGGYYSIVFFFELMQFEFFDFVVVGEGEEVFKSLVDAFDLGYDIMQITGFYTWESVE